MNTIPHPEQVYKPTKREQKARALQRALDDIFERSDKLGNHAQARIFAGLMGHLAGTVIFDSTVEIAHLEEIMRAQVTRIEEESYAYHCAKIAAQKANQ